MWRIWFIAVISVLGSRIFRYHHRFLHFIHNGTAQIRLLSKTITTSVDDFVDPLAYRVQVDDLINQLKSKPDDDSNVEIYRTVQKYGCFNWCFQQWMLVIYLFLVYIVSNKSGVITLTGNDLLKRYKTDEQYKEQWTFDSASLFRIDIETFDCATFGMRIAVTDAVLDEQYSCSALPNVIQIKRGGNLTLSGPMQFIASEFKIKFTYNPFCDSCGLSFTITSGDQENIRSPGFPLSYGSSCICTWNGLVDSSDNVFRVVFSKFHLQLRDSNGDCKDWLVIYDGSSKQSKLLGKFCGHQIPDPIQTSSNGVTVQFQSDTTDDTEVNIFELLITTKKKENDLAGLQSVAAILGAISFGIFVGLLLCSVLYKRWSRQRRELCQIENPEQGNDYDDVIQQAAPPSYRKVMEAPNQFPTLSVDNSGSTVRIPLNDINISDADLPKYPGIENALPPHGLLQPPLPVYDIVSESEDDWLPVRRKNRVPVKTNLIGSDDEPPSYDVVTSDGEVLDNERQSNRTRAKLTSRNSRSSKSCMYQVRKNRSDSDSDLDLDLENTNNVEPRLGRGSSLMEEEIYQASIAPAVVVVHQERQLTDPLFKRSSANPQTEVNNSSYESIESSSLQRSLRTTTSTKLPVHIVTEGLPVEGLHGSDSASNCKASDKDSISNSGEAEERSDMFDTIDEQPELSDRDSPIFSSVNT